MNYTQHNTLTLIVAFWIQKYISTNLSTIGKFFVTAGSFSSKPATVAVLAVTKCFVTFCTNCKPMNYILWQS